MKQTVFFVRFRMSQDAPDALIAEYDNIRTKDVTRLTIPVSGIKRVSGCSPIVFMNDDASTIGESIVSANEGRGMTYDPTNKYLYMQVCRVEIDAGDPNFIRFLGLTEANDMVCIVCESFDKEVVQNV